jgi:hypothetical protein
MTTPISLPHATPKQDIILTIHGDELEGEQTDAGVETDVGLIPWNEVAAFKTYCVALARWVTVPL